MSTGTVLSTLVSDPPQHLTPPLLVRAQLRRPPAETAFTPPLRPTTPTGVVRAVVVPSPSSPARFVPQHLTAPEVTRAQVWSEPAAIAVTPLLRPATSTAVKRLL